MDVLKRERIIQFVLTSEGPLILIPSERRAWNLLALCLVMSIGLWAAYLYMAVSFETLGATSLVLVALMLIFMFLVLGDQFRFVLGIVPESIAKSGGRLELNIASPRGWRAVELIPFDEIEMVGFAKPKILDRWIGSRMEPRTGGKLVISNEFSPPPGTISAGHRDRSGPRCVGISFRLKSKRHVAIGAGLDAEETKLLLKLLGEKFGLPVHEF